MLSTDNKLKMVIVYFFRDMNMTFKVFKSLRSYIDNFEYKKNNTRPAFIKNLSTIRKKMLEILTIQQLLYSIVFKMSTRFKQLR